MFLNTHAAYSQSVNALMWICWVREYDYVIFWYSAFVEKFGRCFKSIHCTSFYFNDVWMCYFPYTLSALYCWSFNLCSLVGTEKAMATHSSTLAKQIPWTEEPGGLQSMGSWRVGHHWATSLSLFTFMHWRRQWQPTPVFLLGESQGRGSLAGCRLWGLTESDTLKQLSSSSLVGDRVMKVNIFS